MQPTHKHVDVQQLITLSLLSRLKPASNPPWPVVLLACLLYLFRVSEIPSASPTAHFLRNPLTAQPLSSH